MKKPTKRQYYIMIDLLKKCFPDKMKTDEWQNKLKEMIPTFGKKLIDDEILAIKTRAASHVVLGLDV